MLNNINDLLLVAGQQEGGYEPYHETLEKITLTGAEYFDLGYKVSDFEMGDTIRFEGIIKGTEASSIPSSGSQLVFSLGNDGGQWLGKAQNGTKYAFGSSNVSTINFNEEVLADVTITLSGSASRPTFTITGSVTSGTETSTITQRSATPTYYDFPLLFGAGTKSTGEKSYGGDYTIKCGKIYINGTMTKDYVPALDSQMRPCLYDKISKTFTYAKKISDGTTTYDLGFKRWNKYNVDYIQSSGTQYINTGYKPTKNTSFDLYGIDMDYASGTTRFGSRTGTYSETFVLATIADSHFRWSYGTGTTPATTDNVFNTQKKAKQISWDATTKRCTITFTDDTTEISAQMRGTDLTSSAIPIYLFAFNSVGEAICGAVKHTRIVFREGDVITRDFKPSVRTYNDGTGVVTKAFMYDEVYNKAYYNAGTGSFKAYIVGADDTVYEVGKAIRYPQNNGFTLNAPNSSNFILDLLTRATTTGSYYILDTRYQTGSNNDEEFGIGGSSTGASVNWKCEGESQLVKTNGTNWQRNSNYTYSQLLVGYKEGNTFKRTASFYDFNNQKTSDITVVTATRDIANNTKPLTVLHTTSNNWLQNGADVHFFKYLQDDNDVWYDCIPVRNATLTSSVLLFDRANNTSLPNTGSGTPTFVALD